MATLYDTDYVIYDIANDNALQDSYGRVLLFGDKAEADADCKGNEVVIRCTELPAHWQRIISYQIDIEKLADTLITLRTDAQMALLGYWDRSDEGFDAQIDLINQAIKK
jgi:hypothetical protein